MRPLLQLYEQHREYANGENRRRVSSCYTREDLLALAGYIERGSHSGAFAGLRGCEAVWELVDRIYRGDDAAALRACLRAQCRREGPDGSRGSNAPSQEEQLYAALFGDRRDTTGLNGAIAALLAQWRDVHMSGRSETP